MKTVRTASARQGFADPPPLNNARRRIAALGLALLAASCTHTAPPTSPVINASAAAATLPYQLRRFQLPGPVAGVVALVDLTDPRIVVNVALTDARDRAGDARCAGQLEVPSVAARNLDFALALNASFFSAAEAREVLGSKLRYFVGNCAAPVGWHVSNGKLVSQPAGNTLRATLVVTDDGNVSIADELRTLPANTRHAVSGNAMVLKAGAVVMPTKDTVRHPRSAVGLSADGATLLLLAVDGRQATAEESPTGQAHSRGATLAELGELMKQFGAADAINLDGGGSTAMVVKDLRTGVFSVANRPSDRSTHQFPLGVERPVVDLIGITLDVSRAATR